MTSISNFDLLVNAVNKFQSAVDENGSEKLYEIFAKVEKFLYTAEAKAIVSSKKWEVFQSALATLARGDTSLTRLATINQLVAKLTGTQIQKVAAKEMVASEWVTPVNQTTKGLADLPGDLIEMIIGYVDSHEEMAEALRNPCLDAAVKAKILMRDNAEITGLLYAAGLLMDVNLVTLCTCLQKVSGNFRKLPPREQEQLTRAGKYIRVLNLSMCKPSDIDGEQLQQTLNHLSHLRVLTLPPRMEKLPSALPTTLQIFKASGATWTKNQASKLLAPCTQLEVLRLGSSIGLKTFPTLSESSKKTLQEIDLSECTDLVDEEFDALKELTSLKRANLKHARLSSLDLPMSVEDLDLSNCENLAVKNFAALKELTSLKRVNLHGTKFDNYSITFLPRSVEDLVLPIRREGFCVSYLGLDLPKLKKLETFENFPFLPKTVEELVYRGYQSLEGLITNSSHLKKIYIDSPKFDRSILLKRPPSLEIVICNYTKEQANAYWHMLSEAEVIEDFGMPEIGLTQVANVIYEAADKGWTKALCLTLSSQF